MKRIIHIKGKVADQPSKAVICEVVAIPSLKGVSYNAKYSPFDGFGDTIYEACDNLGARLSSV